MKTAIPLALILFALCRPVDPAPRDLESRVEQLEREMRTTEKLVDILVQSGPADARAKALKVLEAAGEERKVDLTRALVQTLAQSLDLYKLDANRYPDDLVKGLKDKYFTFTARMLNEKGEAVDAWGRPLVYRLTDKGFDLHSVGGDGKDATADDIR